MAIKTIGISLKDKDGNAGKLIGLSESDVTKLNTAVALTKTNKTAIDELKEGMKKCAKLDQANTFTAANTFEQNITMSVAQDDVSAIEDQHLVTGKALKAVAAKAGGSAGIKWSATGAPDEGTMDADVIYFYATTDSITGQEGLCLILQFLALALRPRSL